MQQHSIQGPAGHLEAVSSASTTPVPSTRTGGHSAMVIAHPHPLYGGTMDNSVVTATAQAANSAGMTAVRFNFRGTGGSTGAHDNGVGEVRDLAAVVSWTRQEFEPESLWLAGYSFGAAMILRSSATALSNTAGVLLIAPPLSVYRFDSGPLAQTDPTHSQSGIPVAVICGANDDFTAPPHRDQLDAFSPILVTDVDGVGHDLGTATGSVSDLNAALQQAITALTLTRA